MSISIGVNFTYLVNICVLDWTFHPFCRISNEFIGI